MLGFYSYCEMNFCMYFYTPLYIICSYLASAAQVDQITEIRALLSEEQRKFFLSGAEHSNTTRAVLIAGALLLAKYQQEFDVIRLIVKIRNVKR